MINVIIDLNGIAYSEYSIFSNYGKTKDPLKTNRDQTVFIQGLTKRIFSILNQLPKGRVVCCIDSKSWRKKILEEYKESREEENGDKKGMDNETKLIFYGLIEEFSELLKRIGIHSSKVLGAEGDDLIFKWAEYFYLNGESSVIVSGDRDMNQCVKGPDEPWIVVWSNRTTINKLYTVNSWIDSINESINQENSIFQFNLSSDNTMAKFVRESNASINIMNVDYFILHKILIGDDGDDVPAVWKVSKGEKYVRVTDKKAQTIIEHITQKYSEKTILNAILSKHAFNEINKTEEEIKENFFQLYEIIDELAGTILRVMGDIDDSDIRKKVSERIIINARAVYLHEDVLPFNINKAIDEDIEKSLRDVKITPGITRGNFLKGTRFDEKVPPKNFDPFVFSIIPD